MLEMIVAVSEIARKAERMISKDGNALDDRPIELVHVVASNALQVSAGESFGQDDRPVLTWARRALKPVAEQAIV